MVRSRFTMAKTKTSHSSKVTTDHDEVRRWAEARGGKPAIVTRTEGAHGEPGILRIDFPGYSGGDSREKSPGNNSLRSLQKPDSPSSTRKKPRGASAATSTSLLPGNISDLHRFASWLSYFCPGGAVESSPALQCRVGLQKGFVSRRDAGKGCATPPSGN